MGTRYHTQKRAEELFPTIAICSNGSEVELDIVFQNRISGTPNVHVVSACVNINIGKDYWYKVMRYLKKNSRKGVFFS